MQDTGDVGGELDAAPYRDSAKKKRRGGSRRKTGCYTCKARHTRCDEDKPQCGNCRRLNLECRPFDIITPSLWSQTDPPTALAQTRRSRPSTASTPQSTWDLFTFYMPTDVPAALDDPSDTMASKYSSSAASMASSWRHAASQQGSSGGSSPVVLTTEMVILLNTYQTGVATWMDIFDHSCAYQREVLRRCTTSELLVRSVCAFTAKNLGLLPSGEVWLASATRYYTESLGLLIAYIGNGQAPEDVLTATMLLCSYEMIANQGVEHQRHFYGAMMLILNRGVNALSMGMDRANFWIFVRHEITVALVNEAPLRISPHSWNLTWQNGHEIDEDVLANQLLYLLARAINVAYGQPTPSSGEERNAIHAAASTWFHGLPLSFLGIKYGETDLQGFSKYYFAIPAAAAAMMWYHLLHILLLAEPTLQHPVNLSQVEYHAVEIANVALSDVPQCVRSFSAQALFFAAKHISGIGRKIKLWNLLDDLETRHGFNTRIRVKKLQQLVEQAGATP